MQIVLGICIGTLIIILLGIAIFLKTFTPETEFRSLLGFSPAKDKELIEKQFRWLLVPKLEKLAKRIEIVRKDYIAVKHNMKFKRFSMRSRIELYRAEISLEVAKLDFEKAYILSQKFGYPLTVSYHPRLYQSYLLEEEWL